MYKLQRTAISQNIMFAHFLLQEHFHAHGTKIIIDRNLNKPSV